MRIFLNIGRTGHSTTIKAGEAICIIEAMKIMNEVESDATGTVTQVLVEDGQAVEFGQPLFVVE